MSLFPGLVSCHGLSLSKGVSRGPSGPGTPGGPFRREVSPSPSVTVGLRSSVDVSQCPLCLTSPGRTSPGRKRLGQGKLGLRCNGVREDSVHLKGGGHDLYVGVGSRRRRRNPKQMSPHLGDEEGHRRGRGCTTSKGVRMCKSVTSPFLFFSSPLFSFLLIRETRE